LLRMHPLAMLVSFKAVETHLRRLQYTVVQMSRLTWLASLSY